MKKINLTLLIIFLAFPAVADTFTLDLGGSGGTMVGRMIQLFMLVTVLSLAPSIVMTMTSFTRLIIVFSFVRSGLGTQQSPPNMVLISLALFLTAFIMGPTIEKIYNEGIVPLMDEKISEKEALERCANPAREFMLKNVREKDLTLFVNLSKIDKIENVKEMPLRILIPAFIISELKRSFEIGFLIFLPFLVIDMVVSAILMSMGMMMLPPVMIALPFKIIFFVLIDGWHLLCGSLVNSFNLG